MSMGTRTAIISFPIKLVAGETEGATTTTQEGEFEEVLTNAKNDIQEQIDDALGEDALNQETLEALTEFVKTTDKQGLQTLSQFAKNPQQLVENELLASLGRAGIHGALAAALVTAIIATPALIRTIVKAMAVKGASLNQDFHRFFDEEAQLGFDRSLQYRRFTGLDVVIMNDNRQLILLDPGFVTSNLVDVETTRSIRNSSNTTQYGYVTGM